jgi:hypothetical protein
MCVCAEELDQCNVASRSLADRVNCGAIPAGLLVLEVVGEVEVVLPGQNRWARCAHGRLRVIDQLDYCVSEIDGLHGALLCAEG